MRLIIIISKSIKKMLNLLKIGFVGCSREKRRTAQHAEDLYSSLQFIKAKEYVTRCYDRWYILSGKYYLLKPSRIIEPYDVSLIKKSKIERKNWAIKVFNQICRVIPPPEKCFLFFHAGYYYRHPLTDFLSEVGYVCEAPLAGMGLGKQFRWYNQYARMSTCHLDNSFTDNS